MTKRALASRKYKQQFLDRGLCIQCRRRPHDPGVQRCTTCRDYHRIRQRGHKEQLL